MSGRAGLFQSKDSESVRQAGHETNTEFFNNKYIIKWKIRNSYGTRRF